MSLIIWNKQGQAEIACGNRGVSKMMRICHSDFFIRIHPSLFITFVFRKDDVLTIVNMTSSFSRGVDPWYRASQMLIVPGFFMHSHRYKHSSLFHSYQSVIFGGFKTPIAPDGRKMGKKGQREREKRERERNGEKNNVLLSFLFIGGYTVVYCCL